MGRHQIVARLSRHFGVVWMNPAHPWRRSGERFFGGPATVTSPSGAGNLVVYQPEAWLPQTFREGPLNRYLVRARINRAKEILRRQGCKRFVLYLWRPEFAIAAQVADVDLVCYHIADEYSFSDDETPVSPREKTLISEADLVFVVSDTLMKKKGHLNAATHLVPNGVDFSAYSSTQPEPADLREVPRPRIGYTGYLKKHLDWDLLEQLAGQHKNWSFVFVGPVSPHPTIDAALQRLRQLPNVHLLGAKTTKELAAYPQHFDVSIMPYRNTDYTRYINPLKLNEYLAAGRPVVSSRIPAVEPLQSVVSMASSPLDWSTAITEALGDDLRSESRVRERRDFAHRHDWDERVAQIARLMLEGLERGPRDNSTTHRGES
jgi:glycosyltransferase involved in cell wall biosynthesis